jgi:thiol-disulfide isomerase/thioredoxin
VYFFAPWCSVCRISMPGLNLLEADDDALTVIAVALDWESVEEVETFITDSGFNGPVLLGHAQTGRDYQISGYPSYYIISQDGQIEHADRGLSTPPGLWLRSRL